MPKHSEKRFDVIEFKAKCLGLIDEVARGKTRRVVITKRNKAVAILSPAELLPDLWGAMRGSVIVAPGVDLTKPTGVKWKAAEDEE